MATNGELREELFATLLRKVERDPYPSSTVMDLIEEMADEDQLAVYCRVLMDKVHNDEFPSLDLVRRVHALA